MIVKGFWHIYMINHWFSIVTDQIRILLTSGLYDECDEINIGCIVTPLQTNLLQKFFVDIYPKLRIEAYSEDPLEYEFLTLRLIEEDKSDYVGFYFHTKAVTRPDDVAQNNLRAWLNESILNRWKGHRHMVEHAWGASSVNRMHSPAHYNGNFWWFNRRYVDRLPRLDTLDHTERWKAEQWICMCEGGQYSNEFLEATNTPFKIRYEKTK